jgi:DNA repair exonuclease SbcCD nuclease subunit
MIILASDYHIGKVLRSHTTENSRTRLQEAILNSAMKVVEQKAEDDVLLCCGDLVDKYKNPEPVVRDALKVASGHDLVLSGNHDIRNREDSFGTLDLIKEVLGDSVWCSPSISNPCSHCAITPKGTVIVGVPHHASQELFEQALGLSIAHLKETRKEQPEGKAILLLHCNYEMPWEAADSTLNLTEDLAGQLLESGFDYIFMGHEHAPAKHFDGRLVILGNTHPTGFGDITDKFFYTLNEETGELEQHPIWTKKNGSGAGLKGYAKVDVSKGDEALLEAAKTSEFVEVVGEVRAEDLSKYNKMLSDAWKQGKYTYAIRSNIEVVRQDMEKKVNIQSMASLPKVIESELTGEMKDLFLSMLKEVEVGHE